jgi:hypothetical protein
MPTAAAGDVHPVAATREIAVKAALEARAAKALEPVLTAELTVGNLTSPFFGNVRRGT